MHWTTHIDGRSSWDCISTSVTAATHFHRTIKEGKKKKKKKKLKEGTEIVNALMVCRMVPDAVPFTITSNFLFKSFSPTIQLHICTRAIQAEDIFWHSRLQYQTMKYADELSLYITINFTAMKSRLLSKWNMITCHNETNRSIYI